MVDWCFGYRYSDVQHAELGQYLDGMPGHLVQPHPSILMGSINELNKWPVTIEKHAHLPCIYLFSFQNFLVTYFYVCIDILFLLMCYIFLDILAHHFCNLFPIL